MAPYTKPETAFRRSEELMSVSQPMSALASISEIFSSKRFRQTPLSSLEPIMLRFIDLCVLLRKTRNIKEGLHMYKNVAQNTSVSSVESVIQHYITKSKEKLTEALEKVDEIEGPLVQDADQPRKISNDVEDLEATETPESLLMSTVSDEKSRDRTYRELVTPWLRSLWEAYRTALDILRNNSRLENFYQQVATEAFEFCLSHGRKTEFRRLTETLRSNLSSSQKYANQAHAINLSDPEVLQRHLETRFQQLNASVKLELWQESFRTAEDINGLISLSKKVPKSHVMSAFYEKMIKVFGVGENYLFHAAAYNKFFSIQSNLLVDQPDKLKKLSGLVLLSALSVPIISPNSAVNNELNKKPKDNEEDPNSINKTKLGRLASLLGLTSLPTRSNLLKDALLKGALKKSSDDIRALYQILEVDFHPLSITSKIQPILVRLAQDQEMLRYIEPLKEVVLTRLFQQLSQVYDSLKLNRVIKFASFGNSDPENLHQTRIRVEKFLMEACKRGELEVTLDHSSQLIKFSDRLFESGINQQITSNQISNSISPLLSLGNDQNLLATHSLTTNHVLQPNSATLLRTHLTRLASALTLSLNHISPILSTKTSTHYPNLDLAKSAAIQILQTDGPRQRKMLLKRKATIEDRKRKVEEFKQKQDIEEAKAKALRIIQIQEEQQIRLQKQNREREIQKLKDEADKIRAAEAEKVALALAAQAGLNVDIKNLKGVDTNTIIQMGVEQIEKEKKELAAKLKTVNKRLDHTERALRREEIPLLQDDYQLQQIRDETNFKRFHEELADGLKTKHSIDLEIKHKLEKILPDFLKFKEKVATERGHNYKRAEQEAKTKIEKAKAERKAQVIKERKQARLKQIEEERLAREKEQEEIRRKQEEERLEEERRKKQLEVEEEERASKAAAEAKSKALKEERERERAAAAEMAAKQAQREAEALARRENKPAIPVKVSAPVSLPTASETVEQRKPMILPGASKPGGWRDRVAAKGGEDSGASSPVGGLSRVSSGTGLRRNLGVDGGAGNDKDRPDMTRTSSGGGTYRAPRTDSNSGNNSRTTSGRGKPRW